MTDTLVVDASVYVAILQQEAEALRLSTAVLTRPKRFMAAPTYLECAIVSCRWQAGSADLDAWLVTRDIEVAPVDHALARLAADAFVRFGKGRHPAGLNFGDCFSYALAKSLGAPLLYKGNDFAKTDIGSVLP